MLQVFDMLAFKNDIGFWKNKQNVEGLSIKVLFGHLRVTHQCSFVSQYLHKSSLRLRCNGAICPAQHVWVPKLTRRVIMPADHLHQLLLPGNGPAANAQCCSLHGAAICCLADNISIASWILLPPLARSQVVIFLYLLDNDTSFVILASTFVGILIEFWKVRLCFCVA